MIDVLGRIADRDRMAMSGLARLALDNAILRLTLPFTIDFYGYRTYRLVDDMRRWLEASKVATLIVLPHWSRLGWAAISAARTLRIAIASTPAVTVAGNHASLVGWENIDLIGCYGSQCRDAFASVGIADEKLFLAGSLTLDHAFAITPEIARRSSPGIESATRTGRRLVLYATSGINADEAAILRAIIKVCADPAANACLVVRPHPSIGRASYAAALEGTPVELAQVETEGSIHDALVAAEFVVTDFSTAGAEAVLLGRPLLTVNTTGTPFAANDYAAFGVAVQACTLDEAGPLLRRLLDEGCFWPQAEAARARFIEAYNWQGDGRACRRFLEFIEQSTADDGDNLL